MTYSDAAKYPHDISSGDAPETDDDNVENVDNADLPRSHSSTIAGKVLKTILLVNLFSC